jgi:hypothetical protein
MIVLDNIDKLKSRDSVALKCEKCSNIFHRPKNDVQKALKNVHYSLNTCSPACKAQARSKVVSTQCWYCGVSYQRTIAAIGLYCSTYCSKQMHDLQNEASKEYVKPQKLTLRYRDIPCKECPKLIKALNKSKMCKACYVKSDKAMEQRGRTFSKTRKYKTNPITGQQFYLMSALEERFFDSCVTNKIKFCKASTLTWKEDNGKQHTYFPDFYLPDKNLFIETKGYLTKEDKIKLHLVKEQNPNIELLLLFRKDVDAFFL